MYCVLGDVLEAEQAVYSYLKGKLGDLVMASNSRGSSGINDCG